MYEKQHFILKRWVNKLPLKNCSQTFSRKTRKGYWKAFELLLIEEGWIWTSLLPSNQTVRPLFAELEDWLRPLRAAATMPCSPAATLGYKPAHSIACKGILRDLCTKKWSDICTCTFSTSLLYHFYFLLRIGQKIWWVLHTYMAQHRDWSLYWISDINSIVEIS